MRRDAAWEYCTEDGSQGTSTVLSPEREGTDEQQTHRDDKHPQRPDLDPAYRKRLGGRYMETMPS